MTPTSKSGQSGKLRIGDHWNAITIIALSQNNPLKAVAEFVENSIDAKAQRITIIRGREQGEPYLKIIDDGEGLPKDENGDPDFKYVATHICDSIKRKLRQEGLSGIQGEFGIGLLSFWTVGEQLKMISSGRDGKVYVMHMVKGQPGYTIHQRKTLVPISGTELSIRPLLPGVRPLSGEKIQRYLASELRDRLRKHHIQMKVIDRIARQEYKVEPRRFSGQLLHDLSLPSIAQGEVYLELYLNESSPDHQVGLFRSGTRVLESIAKLDRFSQEPWTSGYLTGIIDAPFLNLTPGTRDGVIQDNCFQALEEGLKPLEEQLLAIIREQLQAEESKSSQQILRTIQNAMKEALISLPEEYNWFDIRRGRDGKSGTGAETGAANAVDAWECEAEIQAESERPQKQFFDFPGPLAKVRISPASSVVAVNSEKKLRGAARDQRNRVVEQNLIWQWRILEGQAGLEAADTELVTFKAGQEPGLARVEVTVSQGEIRCSAEGIITVTNALFEQPESAAAGLRKGIPAYTFQSAPGELWRSRFDKAGNVIVINKGHRDFVFASRQKTRKLRYICRLYAKELVLDNFPGAGAEELLERMVELSLHAEEYL